MKNIVVTGCNGFIGKKLVDYFLKKNFFVIGVDIVEPDFSNKNFKYLSFDNFFSSKKIDADFIYHLAWKGVSSSDKNLKEKQEFNYDFTKKILEKINDLKIKKIIIPGSMSEFSKYTARVTGFEQDAPSDEYSIVKTKIRKYAFDYCKMHNIVLVWLLITSVYSADRLDANLLTSTIQKLIKNEEIKCTGLEQKWDYLYIDDLIYAMYLIGLNINVTDIVPVGSGEVHPLAFYVKLIGVLLKKEELIKIGVLPYKNKFIDNSIPDISKLTAIGYKVSNSFETNIKLVISKILKYA